MAFNNLLLAVTLTVLWPLGLMGVLAAAEWLERRTLATEVVPRRLRPAASTPPEAVEAEMAGEAVDEAADVAAATWPAARRVGGGGRHLRRAGGGRGGGGRHERRG